VIGVEPGFVLIWNILDDEVSNLI